MKGLPTDVSEQAQAPLGDIVEPPSPPLEDRRECCRPNGEDQATLLESIVKRRVAIGGAHLARDLEYSTSTSKSTAPPTEVPPGQSAWCV